MLRKALENRVGACTNAEFEVICEIITDDLMFNRVKFKKLTNLNYVLNIAVSSAIVFGKADKKKNEPLA